MINQKNKKAFSMMTAIITIVIMATVTALIMNISSRTIKETTIQYQKEQASLLARSYTEQAILYAMHYKRDTTPPSCLEEINATFGDPANLYTITTNLRYIGNDTLLAGCNTTIESWADDHTSSFNNTISVIIDVYVRYKDFDDPANRRITFHRRTLQKL
jgi:type II secretory pathway pseudopilin PulG